MAENNPCEESSGEMKCPRCKYFHSYYGCLAHLFGAKSFVQVAKKSLNNFVHFHNKISIDNRL